jgi:tetratricopeptide (TPR) repeat protein
MEYYGKTVNRRWSQSAHAEGTLLALVLVCVVLRTAGMAQTGAAANSHSAPPAANAYVGNAACASCHAAIYDSYQRTPMAHASGPAVDGLKAADFTHAKSGVHYQIYAENGKAWLAFDRPGDSSVKSKRELLYFIGSGRRGRSYLFSEDGFVFESPVNWYADRQLWDMAPAYSDARQIPLNLPAYTSCLECHTSGMQLPVKGTENKYPAPLFTQAGVGCERCHGPGAAHLEVHSKGAAIVNPAKLSAEQRDSVCMQCHLEGNVAIERPARHVYDFRPGDILDDYVRHYLLTGNPASGLGANSQFEALAQSTCKKKSGDAMSCTSCHNPHESPSAEARASYFRGKCLACHGNAFAATHHPDKTDCTACHMPSSLSADISHTEVTDHRIQRRPQLSPHLLQDPATPKSPLLVVPFPDWKQAEDDVRDLALAWQSVAGNGVPQAVHEAERLLPLAVKQSPDDPALLSTFAYTELNHGAVDHARELYQRALALDPSLIDAASNLGVIEAKSGHLGEAVKLWQGAFERAPGKSGIGMNLARAFCASRQVEEARSYVERVLRFNPDLSEAKQMLQRLSVSPPKCGS